MIQVLRYWTDHNCVRHYRLLTLVRWLPPEAAVIACVKAGSLGDAPLPVPPVPPPAPDVARPAPDAPQGFNYPELPGLFGLVPGRGVGDLGYGLTSGFAGLPGLGGGGVEVAGLSPFVRGAVDLGSAGEAPIGGFLPLTATPTGGSDVASEVPIAEPASCVLMLGVAALAMLLRRGRS